MFACACMAHGRAVAMWTRLWAALRRAGDAGVTSVELGLLIAGIAIVVIPSIFALNSALTGSFQDTAGADPGVCATPGCDAYATVPINLAQNGLIFATGYSPIYAPVFTAITPQTPVVTGAAGVVSYSAAGCPTWLTVSHSSGTLSGTTPATPETSTTCAVTATDAGGKGSATRLVPITVTPPDLVFSVGYTQIVASRNVAITNQTPTVTGAAGILSFELLNGPLPTGLSLDPNSGTISGTPALAADAANYTIRATDDGGAPSATTSVSIAVYDPITITYPIVLAPKNVVISVSPTVSTLSAGAIYSFTGTLPNQLTFDTANGTIGGKANGSASDSTIVVTVTDGPRTASVSVPIGIGPELSYSHDYTGISVAAGDPIDTQTPVLTGGAGTRAFSIDPALPAGLILDSTTGALSGIPSTKQTAETYTVTAVDLSGSVTSSFTITVTGIHFTREYTDISATADSEIPSQTPATTGGYGSTSYAISPAVPGGMSFRTSDGRISGTPSTPQSVATYTVSASDSSGSVTTTFTITVSAAPPTLTGCNNINRKKGSTYSDGGCAGSGGSGSGYSYGISAGTLPAGLSIASSTGVISGTPKTAQASANVTVEVTDGNGNTGTQVISAIVYTTPGAPGFTSARKGSATKTVDLVWTAPTSDGYNTSSWYYQVEWRVGSGSWTVYGTTYTGLTATVTMATSDSATYTFRITAHNAAGFGAASVTKSTKAK